MLRHIVFFSVRNNNDIDALHAGLRLLTQIPHGSVVMHRAELSDASGKEGSGTGLCGNDATS